ncbi:hemagglutinin repeat-containing protein, partial [Neisseriaceae bacterium ESL0693]|nr:hemagglutinin repeat-containing protein [Neisseriaceae bacterium ESL0693]
AEQMQQLTSNIVWLENQTVTLADGSSQTVLVPKVYLVGANTQITPDGALISANNINLTNAGHINNQGTISAGNNLSLGAQNIDNSGLISADNLILTASNQINFNGGVAVAKDNLSLKADQINLNTTTVNYGDDRNGGQLIDRVAGVYVTGEVANSNTTQKDSNNNNPVHGLLSLEATHDLNSHGAQISNQSQTGTTQLISHEGDINLGTVSERQNMASGSTQDKNHWINHYQSETGTSIDTHGDINLISGHDINIRQGDINSDEGRLNLTATNDINIEAGRQQTELDHSVYIKTNGIASKKTQLDQYQAKYDEAVGSNLGASQISLTSGHDIKVEGSNIISDHGSRLLAGNDININAADNSYYDHEYHKKTKSGLMSAGGGVGFSVGKEKDTIDNTDISHIHSGSLVGSLGGDTTIVAGHNYNQTGSSVLAPNGNINIAAQQINVAAAMDTYQNDNIHTYEKSGFTVAVNSPVIDAVQKVNHAARKVGKSKNDRVNAMAVMNTGYDTFKTYQAIDHLTDANPQTNSAGIKVSLTYGQQKSKEEYHSSDSIASASQIGAGGQVNLIASGAGQNSNINIIGSDVGGDKGTYLWADNQINLLAAEQQHSEHSKKTSSGFNVGAAISYANGSAAYGVTIGGNHGKGHGNGNGNSYLTSHIGSTSGNTTLHSGGDTNITGAQVTGNSIKLDAANLNIASVQDTSKYHSTETNISAEATIGYGASGSADYSHSKINADYASVTEQSGIFAGDGGYNVNVGGHTQLTGALITSTDKAEQEHKNQLTTGTIGFTDLHNHSDYKGEGIGIGVGGSLSGGSSATQLAGHNLMNQGNTGASGSVGFGSDKGHDKSTTHSGINTANINITDKEHQAQDIDKVHTNITTDNYAEHAGYLSNNFDKDKVQEEIDTQVDVSKEFDQNRKEAVKTIYAVADQKRKEAEDIRKNNYINGLNGYNTQESLALEASADKWDKAGFYVDLALGGIYGGTNAWALGYAGGGAVVKPVYRAATRPTQIWKVVCTQDSLYCSNTSYDGDKQRPIYEDNPFVEIGDKRQIFNLADIMPNPETGIITISNPGILNPLNDAEKNAIKQNEWAANAQGIYVIQNPPTGNYLSELLYAGYDKVNDLMGGWLPLTSAEKTNQAIFAYAKDNNYLLNINSHSRGGMTTSVAMQDANSNGLIYVPVNNAQFYGTATNVDRFREQLENVNKFEGSTVTSAVHYTDFVGRSPWLVGRSPLVVGGNAPTGGVENHPFMYSHSGYFAEKPTNYLMDEQGHLIDKYGNRVQQKQDNPYLDEFNEKWNEGKNHNQLGENPSKPVLVRPKPKSGIK